MKKGKKPASPQKAKRWKIIVGDVRKVAAELAALEPRSFDAVLCDPPYDLTADKKGGTGDASVNLSTPHGRARITAGGGFMGQAWDASGVAFDPDTWKAIHRLLRPGAHLLAAGGTRTFHRMVCAVEDAGFEIRDTIAWLYGQGFPKSLDVSKAIESRILTGGSSPKNQADAREITGQTHAADGRRHSFKTDKSSGSKQGVYRNVTGTPWKVTTDAAKRWNGYGTALKPSWEGWTLARKRMKHVVANNVRVHGTGALAIDACRIEATSTKRTNSAEMGYHGGNVSKSYVTGSDVGRWPANVVLDEEAGAMLDAQSATSRFFYCAKVSTKERNAGLASLATHGPLDGRTPGAAGTRSPRAGANRNGGTHNPHPTLKPISLTTYLAKLLLPPKNARSLDRPRRILVPFAGAGSEMIGALLAGWDEVVGIELSSEYAAIARKRIAHHVRESAPSKGALYESLHKKGKKP